MSIPAIVVTGVVAVAVIAGIARKKKSNKVENAVQAKESPACCKGMSRAELRYHDGTVCDRYYSHCKQFLDIYLFSVLSMQTRNII